MYTLIKLFQNTGKFKAVLLSHFWLCTIPRWAESCLVTLLRVLFRKHWTPSQSSWITSLKPLSSPVYTLAYVLCIHFFRRLVLRYQVLFTSCILNLDWWSSGCCSWLSRLLEVSIFLSGSDERLLSWAQTQKTLSGREEVQAKLSRLKTVTP